ncbi:MAG: hypothetical protein N0A16_07700 [Blastocatellia bacterium]|nr:hypothetical protein [Blastocatellia bacterium]MCS7157597.1 hypothetical protein [Blastocatellia bacterium]MCX7751862.1 hypothetical protein [Blastocatellia bacterium]MDW8166968.1 hypothetical protein [Acidobacteriota bacterium]MDW8257072.1 hypothetical protein [Acidobacteriota bacterium]
MHLLAMVLFALCVSTVFAIVTKEEPREQLHYAVKAFFAFLGIALAIGWLMYPFS